MSVYGDHRLRREFEIASQRTGKKLFAVPPSATPEKGMRRWTMRIVCVAIAFFALPLPALPEDSAKLKAAKAVVDRELPVRCERGALIRKMRGTKAGSSEWLEIKRKMDVSIAKTDADRIVRGTRSIAEGLDAQDTKALETYYYEVEKRCPK